MLASASPRRLELLALARPERRGRAERLRRARPARNGTARTRGVARARQARRRRRPAGRRRRRAGDRRVRHGGRPGRRLPGKTEGRRRRPPHAGPACPDGSISCTPPSRCGFPAVAARASWRKPRRRGCVSTGSSRTRSRSTSRPASRWTKPAPTAFKGAPPRWSSRSTATFIPSWASRWRGSSARSRRLGFRIPSEN